MTTFKDLEFKKHPNHSGGVQAVIFFPNGYGASVIKSPYSYGGDEGLYELAVIAGNKESFMLTYSTPVTDDVLGHLSSDQVTDLLKQIEALESAK